MPNLFSKPSRPSTMAPFSAKHLLTRTLMAAALLGGGASLLSAGNAQAVQVFCGGPAVEVGDKRISNIVCNGFTPTFPAAFLKFTQAGVTYDFGSSFDPLLGTPGSISYKLEIFNSPNTFAGVELDSDCDDLGVEASACNVTKKVWGDSLNGSNLLASLSSPRGEEAFGTLSGQTIFVLDAWAPTEGAFVSTVDNTYTQTSVPGPLPVLGAGVAFGFSRKLRRRINGARIKA